MVRFGIPLKINKIIVLAFSLEVLDPSVKHDWFDLAQSMI